VQRESTRERLRALSLPRIVMHIFDGQVPHPALCDICASPLYVYARGTKLPSCDLIPLWENGVVVTAFQAEANSSRFIQFSLEQPSSVEMLELWELEHPDETLKVIADLFEFHHLPRLIAECSQRSAHEPELDYRAWRSKFLVSCT
jgi:hypothetical protein